MNDSLYQTLAGLTSLIMSSNAALGVVAVICVCITMLIIKAMEVYGKK